MVRLRDANVSQVTHSLGTIHGNTNIVADADPPEIMGSTGLHTVTVTDSWFYDLLGVLTLGLYKPYKVSYRNKTPGVDSGSATSPAKLAEGR